MKYIKENNEVLYIDSNYPTFSPENLSDLKARALKNDRKRIRVCFHKTKEDSIHEMLIVMHKDNYIQPHLHESKIESYKVIEGSAILFIFDESGKITHFTYLDSNSNDKAIYARIPKASYHSLVFLSDFFIFIECGEGPFTKNSSKFAPWAPTDLDEAASKEYIKSLLAEVKSRDKIQ